MKSCYSYASCLLLLILNPGCGGKDRNWKETIPVQGEVIVDGQPAEGVMVNFNPLAGMDTAQPTSTSAMTDKEGKFKASTYQVGDGVPAGEYQVTFKWPTLNKISMTFDGDKLKGKYSDAQKSQYTITVVSGTPIDMGRIELKGN